MNFMKCYYDFHIHSCLSPCGDADMTPNNIVNMSIIKGLDAIAVTDHNCAANLCAIQKCAENKIILLYGMEVESSDEVHMVCLFADYEMCKKMECEVLEAMPAIKNDESIFGQQLIMNEEDEITGKKTELLVTASNLDVYEIVKKTHKYNGAVIAAHVDKSSYSILSNLGFIPDDLDIDCIEISRNGTLEETMKKHTYLDKFMPVFSSDAHYLADISERKNSIDVENLTPEGVIHALLHKKTGI